jgi:hypothetical protein
MLVDQAPCLALTPESNERTADQHERRKTLPLPEADVVRYAQELRPQPQAIPMPLDVAWLPAGMTIAGTSDGAVDEAVSFTTEKGIDQFALGITNP